MNIVEFLKNKGYKSFRYTKNGLIECNNNFDFSTMREGGIDVRLIKENSEFIYGLHESGLPPILISPRPNNIQRDFEMARFLKENDIEKVFEILYPLSIKNQ